MDTRMPWPEGTVLALNRQLYRIERLIGRGGNAMVYQAFYQDALQPERKHRVLIKELFPYDASGTIRRLPSGELSCDGAQELYALHEASFLRGNHVHLDLQDRYAHRGNTNINSCKAYGTLYTVLDDQGGETLRDAFDCFAASSLSSVVACMQNLLDALKPFHALDMLHLDISPDNILLLPLEEGQPERLRRVILFDYNSTWSLEEATDRTGRFYSQKEPYSAPELRLGSYDEVSAATDLYSVCVIFAELLRKAPLDYNAISGKRLNGLFDVRDTLLGGQPYTVIRQTLSILKKGLRLSPTQRYQSISELASALSELAARIEGIGISPGALWEMSEQAYKNRIYRNPVYKYLTESMLSIEIALDGTRIGPLDKALDEWNTEAQRHVMLTGAAGSGKTSALLRLWRNSISTGIPTRQISLYIPLFLFNGQPRFIEEYILSKLRYASTDVHYQDALHMLDELFTGRPESGAVSTRFLLLLDGLNEVALGTQSLLRNIRALAEKANVQIVLSARTADPPVFARVLQTLPLQERETARYLMARQLKPPSGETQRLLSNPMLLALYADACGAGMSIQSETNAGDFLRAYFRELAKVYSQNASLEEACLAEFALQAFFPCLAAHLQKKHVYQCNATDLLSYVERWFHRIQTVPFLHAFPQYIGKVSLLKQGAANGEAWFTLLINCVLQKKFGLLLPDGDAGYRAAHGMYVDALAPLGAQLERQLSRKRVARLLPRILCAAVIIAALALGAARHIGTSLPYPHTASQSRATKRAMNALCCNLAAMDTLLSRQYDALDRISADVLDGEPAAYAAWLVYVNQYKQELSELALYYSSEIEDVLAQLSQQDAPVSIPAFRSLLSEPIAYQSTALEQLACLEQYITPNADRSVRDRAEAVSLLRALLDSQRDASYAEVISILNCFSGDERRDVLEKAIVYLPVFGQCFIESGAGIDADSVLTYSEHNAAFIIADLRSIGFYAKETP